MKTLRSLRALRPRNQAFTLLEIMLVIIIVVALMAVLIPNIRTSMQSSKISNAEIYIQQLNGAMVQYEAMNGMPPSTAQGLNALKEKPQGEPHPKKWRQVLDTIQTDPWGMDYRYEFPGKRNKAGYDIYSCGPDRSPNTDDDVGNWEVK